MNQKSFRAIRVGKSLIGTALDANTTFVEIASKFQWECKYIPPSNAAAPPGVTHLIKCWGKFQDGIEYMCAEYLELEGEYVDGVWYESDPEAILRELVITFDLSMRLRFDRIEDDRTENP